MPESPAAEVTGAEEFAPDDDPGMLDLLLPLVQSWRLIVIGSLAVGLAALGVAFVLTPVYTGRTTFLPPQQQQSGLASAALASLGALGGLAGLAGGGAIKSPADQYVALMQSVTVADRLIDRFDLVSVYDANYRVDARKALDLKTRITVGKKDGLITVEVEDESPTRAAEMANAYVEELRRLTSVLAISEAQQRRVFFEKELKEARDQLARAQQEMQASGITAGALRAEPRSAAESYARLKAEVTTAEVRVQVMRRSMADSSPELQRQLAQLAALREQLARLEQADEVNRGPDYVTKYREFKYREALFEMFARQYELARVDESREGALIQTVDPALPPERRTRPKRALTAISATAVGFLFLSAFVLARQSWRRYTADPRNSARIAETRAAMGRR